jgi:hypothetical protein
MVIITALLIMDYYRKLIQRLIIIGNTIPSIFTLTVIDGWIFYQNRIVKDSKSNAGFFHMNQ